MKRLLLSISAGILFSGYASGFTISDIQLEGLQRVSAGTVYNAIPVVAGDEITNDQQISSIIRLLYRTGYFDDVIVSKDDDVLIITVKERPSINKINISGNKTVKEEDLIKGLNQAGLLEGEIFQRATLDIIRLELEKQYMAQGRYNAKISTDIKEQPNNQVTIDFNISEGDVATIQHVNIVGNTIYSNKELLDLFEIGTSTWTSWYSGNDKYAREKLSGDLERLRSKYLDNGYINFNIESTQVAITPDKKGVYITVNISEGDQYRVGKVKLAGDLVFEEKAIKSLLKVKKGQIFSRKLLAESEKNISQKLGREGYIFSKINSVPEVNDKKHTIDVSFIINPGKITYVRRIEFVGNTKTDDEVLRREMRQLEGSRASTQDIEQSKLRLNRLGYFRDVKVETIPVPGSNDMIDVQFSVEEQPSGSITASLGYSQSDGILLGGSINQKNFLGTGNHVSFSANSSSYRELYSFSYNNPYYTVDGVSRGFSLYYSEANYDETDVTNYNVDNMGANINFGYPISETSHLSFGMGVDDAQIKEGIDPAYIVEDFLQNEGDEFANFKTNFGISTSALNHGLLPTRGYSHSLSMSIHLPGSDLFLYKTNYRGQFFIPIFSDYALRFHGKAGYVGGYGDTTSVPFYENYYGGGFGSIRGYADNTLGPQALQRSGIYDPIGGNVMLEGGLELLFPMPFVEDRRSLRTSFFLDAGNVFDTNCSTQMTSSNDPDNPDKHYIQNCYKPDLKELRYSTGIGLTWITPMGPLTFSLAKALNPSEYDEEQVFQFSLGASF